MKRFLASVAVGVCALAALPSSPLAQSAKHVITHEDVFLMKRLGTPAVSPDGKWAVVSVSEPAYIEAEQASDLWIVPTDGSAAPRRITATKAAESGVTWSPDGKRLAFATRRDGDDVAQIYVMDLSVGGEAQRVTNISTGARDPLWRPDGKAILFTSDVYPGAATDEENKKAAAERKARKWNARVYDGFPVRDWDRWLDDRRPSLFVQKLDTNSAALDTLAGSALVKSPGFGGQMGSGSENLAAVWSTDGKAVLLTATTTRNEAAFADVDQKLWVVMWGTSSNSGETRPLWSGPGTVGVPAVRTVTGVLYFTIEPSDGRTYHLSRLMRFAQSENRLTNLTTAFDRSVGAYVVSPDGKSVYFLAEDGGRQKLFHVDADGKAVKEVGALTNGTYTSFSLAGPAIAPVAVAVWESAVNPPELVRIDLATGKATPLSHFNSERAASIDWQPLEEFTFTSATGRKIQNFVCLPPAFDPAKKYPLFVVLHGGPHSMWIDQFVIRWNYHLLGAPGYVVLLTNYTGSTGFGEQFSQAIQGDPFETPGQEVLQAVDEAIKKYPFIDGTRMAAGGASYGGHMANWLAVSTTRFKALVSHAGLFDQAAQWGTSDTIYSREVNMGGPVWENGALWKTQNPILKSASIKTPMLVSVGERDFRVPMNNALQLWSTLQRLRVPGRLIVFPDENHWVLKGENSRFYYGEVHAWLAKWLR